VTGVRTVATIGVYGFDQAAFMASLARARVRVLLDVRQRRGVRGPEYAWANSARLQVALAEAGIEYRHLKELAPTTELRQLQYHEDDRRGVGKRSRAGLAPEYARRYTTEILDGADLGSIADGSALLCVERDPEACHRSLIAERLAAKRGIAIDHLRSKRAG
jgi:uncharacterized protein (DUF488 family)